MEVRVGAWVWLPKVELGHTGMAVLKKRLTLVPRKMGNYDDELPRPIEMYAETETHFGVPREYFFRESTRAHVVNYEVALGRPVQFTNAIRMTGERVEQATAVEELSKYFASGELGAILRADPGCGKTVCGLEMVARLGRTTLVVLHKEFLIRQWRERIEKFLPGAKIGLIKGEKADWKDKDIVLASMQTLAKAVENPSRFPSEFYEAFGLVVVDELHRLGAFTWSQVMGLLKAKYRLGLTATPRRKDGCHDVFFWHVGPIVYEMAMKMGTPRIRWLQSQSELPRWLRDRHDVSGAQIASELAKDRGRNRQIVEEMVRVVQAKSKRKVLVISERLEQLLWLKDDFAKVCGVMGVSVTTSTYTGEWFTGETKPGKKKGELIQIKKKPTEAELKLAERAQVIFATKQLVEEGFDIAAIDTVVIATPIGDVEQLIGRGQRFCVVEPDKDPEKCVRDCQWRAGECVKKPDLVVVDVDDVLIKQLSFKTAARRRFYESIKAT